MKQFFAALVLVPVLILAQEPSAEERELRQSLGEAGSSPVEFIRAIEGHLKKYPESAQRIELERTLFRAAAEINDDRRVAEYGQRLLEKKVEDIETLDRVSRALIGLGGKESAERILKLAARLEERLRENERDTATQQRFLKSPRDRARFREEIDRSLGRALLYQARAYGLLGDREKAATAAQKSFDAYPQAEAAREAARWLPPDAALAALANAFALAAEADRAGDRKALGERYRQVKGSEDGLGALVLEAYDRTAALLAARRANLQKLDPNLNASAPLDFTLTSLKGEPLALRSLKGKVVVLDFWATWCGPCRVQYPLYEEVKQKFKGRADVIFLAVNTDEDRSVVEPFLKQLNWNKAVYYDEGLSANLRVSSIPTTVIFGKSGRIFSRLNGFLPERFVDMLTERIEEALAE
ncbi:MAG: TlpA disulfide reductase family protein [Bryobacteraceae bacterium]|nr:TlpA disulfide reductase family protein [Bryobacteraceae bacterium]